MSLPNSRNTNYQAAGGEIKSKDLDALQDGLVAFTGRRPGKIGTVDLTGLTSDSGVFSPYANAFLWTDTTLAGLKYSWAPGTPRGTLVAGPALAGTTTISMVAHPSAANPLLLICRNSSGATASNRLCYTTNGSTITSITVPVGSTAKPVVMWAGSKFLADFGNGDWYASQTAVTGWALIAINSIPEKFAVGQVTVGSSTVTRGVFCTNLGAPATGYTDDNGTTWGAETNHSGSVDGIAWTAGVGFLIVGQDTGAVPRAKISQDGATWTAQTVRIYGLPSSGPVVPRGLSGLCVSDGRFFAWLQTDNVGGFSIAFRFLVMSIDGANWSVVDHTGYSGPEASQIIAGSGAVVTGAGTASWYQ